MLLFFPCYEIFMGKPMDSSCDVDYHRVELHGKETAILWDDGKLLLWNGLPTKGAQPYFQSGPLSEILVIANLRHAASKVKIWAEPESRL